MKELRGCPALEDFISEEIRNLSAYSKRENVNQKYIDYENKRLAKLSRINNDIILPKYPEIWLNSESQIRLLLEKDGSLKSFLIFINMDYEKGKNGIIYIQSPLKK